MPPHVEVQSRSQLSRTGSLVPMRQLGLVIAFTLLTCVEALSQIDSVLTLYPLGAGYRWQYTHKIESRCGNWDRGTWDEWIDKDTLLSSGKRYWIRNLGKYPQVSERHFERLDSTTANLYEIRNWPGSPEQLADSLMISVGDTLDTGFGRFLCWRLIPDTICGVITRTKALIGLSQYSGTNRSFSFGFGQSFREFWSMDYPFPACPGGSDLYELVYARIGMKEYGTLLSVEGDPGSAPQGFTVLQNYPNPFNPSTAIQISVAHKSSIVVTVFDLLGVEVAALMDEVKDPGTYSVRFNGAGRPSGIYLCRVKAGDVSQTIRLVLLR